MTDENSSINERIVNLRQEILNYASEKTHRHLDLEQSISTLTGKFNNYLQIGAADSTYVRKDQHIIDTSVTASSTNPVQSKGIKSYVDNAIKNFISKSAIETLIENKIAAKDKNIFASPDTTDTKINELFEPGYYKYVGNKAAFTCAPDTVQYKNGLIRVERQSNHIIQHVYSTTWSKAASTYKIDGREFTRYGYTTTSGDSTTPHWGDWHVAHLPWKKRPDLVDTLGPGVKNQGTFDIYECTAGYVFRWTQNGSDQKYILSVPQYNFSPVCTFTKNLPIEGTFTIGNLIGHLDVAISASEFKVRSINQKGEHIIGINMSYFIPRKN